ncbi:MAG: class I SAM-dependent methyltransferase [bacterium]
MAPSNHTHWQTIYLTKQPEEVSWWQENPKTSLEFINSFGLPHSAQIIDVGGGDSRLVDCLLDEGFTNVTVLDISERALERAQKRLGEKAQRVTWLACNILEFKPSEQYDLWHDRAMFHFLTAEADQRRYVSLARNAVKESGFMTLGTFSTTGPTSCSGLTIRQYDEAALEKELQNGFGKIHCITEDHTTPFGTKQNFLFCSFRRQKEE